MATKIQMQEKTGASSYEVLHPETVAEQVIEGVNLKFMTPTERTKLGGIQAGAQVNVIERIQVNGADIAVGANKTVNIPIATDYIKVNQKGVANGVATLDGVGKVPTSQLPSYVDDVLEYDTRSAFPSTGESGKIYIAKDTNLTYRWSGSTYVEISQSLALGETDRTAYPGNKGKLNRDDINEIISGEKTVGRAQDATKLANVRTISISGDASGSVSFDGSANANISIGLSTTGVPAGTYTAVSVDGKGRVVNGMQSIEFGTAGQTVPSASLIIGGLFFKRI